jgi:hypothetical protein
VRALQLLLAHPAAHLGPPGRGSGMAGKSWLSSRQCCGSGIRCLFDPGIRDGQKVRIRELRKPFFGVKILKLFDADPGWKKFGFVIRDGKNSDPG